MKKLFLLLTSLILMWSNVYADYDYEYAFNYETDYASGGCIWVNSSGDFGIMNIFMMKNYASTNNVGYPAIRIDILDNQYTSEYMAVEGDYTTLTNTLNAQNCGKIINSTTAGGNNVFTAFWDASGTKHTFQSVTVSVRGDDEHPFFALYGTCTDGKTVYATIGFVPGDAEAIYENLTGKSYSANNISTKKDGSTITLKATCSGSSTISGYKFTVNETIQLAFRGTTTSYIPTKSDYKINPSNQFGSIYPNLDATDDASESIISQYLTNTSYSFWNYYLVTHGIVQVLNPNCLDKPMYVKINQIQNIPQGSADITIGSIPTLRILTVSTAGTGANGSASISCAEGHGYPSGGFLAGNSGNYYYDGTTVTLVAPAAQEGYRFTKWTKNGTQKSTSASYSLGNVSSTNSGAYVANFEGNTYKVVFKGNDNTDGSMSDQTGFKYGTGKALTSNAFSRVYTVTYNYHDATSGNSTESSDATYTFNGWNTAADGSGTTYTNGFSLSTPTPIPSHNGTVNLYAQWNSASVTLPSPKKTGHNFLGWYTEETGGTRVGGAGDSYTPTAGINLHAQWEAITYTVTIAKNNNGYGTLTEESDNVRVINNVPYGTVITTGTGENANKVTINGTTVTATPAASDAQYSYAFSGWTNGTATVTGNMTVTATFTRTTNSYDITFKNADGTTLKKLDGTTDAVYTVAYGETPVYDGATPTKTADSEYTYTFNAWTPAIATVTTAATYTATYSTTKVQYTLAWDVNGGNALTGTYTSGTIDWGTPITAPADPTKAGYTFAGWDSNNDGTAEEVAATMPTNNVTYKALWNAISSDLVLKDGVSDGQTDINFDEFAATYNGQTMSSVTLNRTFTAGNWATLCLPFDVDESQLSSTGLFRKVYEFRYATGSADVGDQVTFHFRVATSMEAGRGYLVKGTSGMGSSFVFNNVTINTSADTKTDVNDLKGVNYYYDESVGSSEIVIVGVLRSGTLSNDGRKVMGLANNMIWYPHTNGNPMPAYRAYFYNPDAPDTAPMPRVRIVVEGEGETELEVVDGELYDAGGDVRAPSKYIRNGVLIIERNGVRYDAQGKRL